MKKICAIQVILDNLHVKGLLANLSSINNIMTMSNIKWHYEPWKKFIMVSLHIPGDAITILENTTLPMAFRAAAWNVKRADKNAMVELAEFIQIWCNMLNWK